MRKSIFIAIAAAGFALAAVPDVSAAPLYGTGPASAADAVGSIQDTHYRRYRHSHRHHYRRCWWRHGRKICRW